VTTIARKLALLAAVGAKVVVNYSKSVGPAEEVARQIRHTGGEATAARADLAARPRSSRFDAAPGELRPSSATFVLVEQVRSAAFSNPGP
jgi:hypothetical protein